MTRHATRPDATLEPDAEIREKLELGTASTRRWWRWAAPAGGAFALLVLTLALRSGGEPEMEWSTVERGSLTVTVEAVGNLEPRNEVEIGPELSGTVEDVRVDVNDHVEAGDILATLDAQVLQAQAAQADAEVATARASLRQAEILREVARLERTRALEVGQGGAIAQAELDRTRLEHESRVAGVELARAQLQRAEAARQVARANLARTVIRSPTDGIVLTRNVDAGQAVVTSLQSPVLFRVAESLDEMRLSVEIDEADIAKLSVGQTATFTVAAWPEMRFEASVSNVHFAPLPGVEVVTYEAELRVSNPEGRLRPGMSASARVATRTYEEALRVPNEALRFDPPGMDAPRGPHVWVRGPEGLQAVMVSLGPTDGTHTVVSSDDALAGRSVAVALADS